jgi:hypothetical protein
MKPNPPCDEWSRALPVELILELYRWYRLANPDTESKPTRKRKP